MYSWLQAAQDFREKQDRKNNENLRKSYRIRLGWKKIIRILWNPWVPFHLFVIYSSSSAETKQFNAANAFIDFLLRRPLNSVLFFLIVFFSFFFFFFCEMLVTLRFAKVYYFLLSMKSRIFFLL